MDDQAIIAAVETGLRQALLKQGLIAHQHESYLVPMLKDVDGRRDDGICAMVAAHGIQRDCDDCAHSGPLRSVVN